MKFQQSLLLGLTTGAIALTATPTFSQSSSNASVDYRCNIGQNVLTTVAFNQKKEIPLINWKSEYIESQNPVRDCEEAANKLQNSSIALTYLGIESNPNNQTVVCLIEQRGDACNLNTSYKLFRVKTTATPQDLTKALSQIIIDGNLAEVDTSKIESLRGVVPMYTQIKSRAWWQLF